VIYSNLTYAQFLALPSGNEDFPQLRSSLQQTVKNKTQEHIIYEINITQDLSYTWSIYSFWVLDFPYFLGIDLPNGFIYLQVQKSKRLHAKLIEISLLKQLLMCLSCY